MALVRWSPFRDLLHLRDEMDRLFERVFGREALPERLERRPLIETRGWTPAIDMFERKDALVIRAALPGLDRKDIEISVSGDTLTIQGERKAEKEVKEEDYYFSEQAYGRFYRTISLPSGVDPEKIIASYKSGVLEVVLPKAEVVKPKRIEIAGE